MKARLQRAYATLMRNVHVDLIRPTPDILAELRRRPIRTRVSLSGPMIVARVSAYAKLWERLEAGQPFPDYMKNDPVYYAGPAKTPPGFAPGPSAQPRRAEWIVLSTSSKLPAVPWSCWRRGTARLQCAPLAKNMAGSTSDRWAAQRRGWRRKCIRKMAVVEYPELGMEAVWRIEVEKFPAFIVIDDKGNDFFKELNLG
jgi:fumarate hydratase class I